MAALAAVITARAAESDVAERKLREPLTPWVKSGLVKGTRTKV